MSITLQPIEEWDIDIGHMVPATRGTCRQCGASTTVRGHGHSAEMRVSTILAPPCSTHAELRRVVPSRPATSQLAKTASPPPSTSHVEQPSTPTPRPDPFEVWMRGWIRTRIVGTLWRRDGMGTTMGVSRRGDVYSWWTSTGGKVHWSDAHLTEREAIAALYASLGAI